MRRRSVGHCFLGLIALVPWPVAAYAVDVVDATLAKLMTGRTVYVEFTSPAGASIGKATIYFAGDGRALFKTAQGAVWRGTWLIRNDTLCTDWKELQGPTCTRYEKRGDTFLIYNAATGQPRGRITKTAEGDAEQLAR